MKTYTLISSLVIALVLLVTAVIKLFYPTQFLEWLQFTVAGGEAALAVILLLFHRRLFPWMIAVLLFAGWGGYSLFWLMHNLPCGCLGKLYDPPRGLSLGIDIIFYCMSFVSVYLLSRKKVPHYNRLGVILLVVSLICGGIGFVFAENVYDMLAHRARKVSLQMRSFIEQAR